MNRFDIVLGHYVFCTLWHSGQNCELYEKLCRISKYFNPGILFSETKFFNDDEYANAVLVYDNLVEKYGFEK